MRAAVLDQVIQQRPSLKKSESKASVILCNNLHTLRLIDDLTSYSFHLQQRARLHFQSLRNPALLRLKGEAQLILKSTSNLKRGSAVT